MFITGITVQGDSGKAYAVSAQTGGVLHCTCLAWKFQNVAPAARTCKHIEFARKSLAR